MKVKCKNCLPEEGIDIPDFNESEKSKLLGLIIQSAVHSIKLIIDNYSLIYRDAKFIVTHMNSPHGHCNCCNFDKLEEEYIKCPKCGALNFNWK